MIRLKPYRLPAWAVVVGIGCLIIIVYYIVQLLASAQQPLEHPLASGYIVVN
jgi:hypothetical protein